MTGIGPVHVAAAALAGGVGFALFVLVFTFVDAALSFRRRAVWAEDATRRGKLHVTLLAATDRVAWDDLPRGLLYPAAIGGVAAVGLLIFAVGVWEVFVA